MGSASARSAKSRNACAQEQEYCGGRFGHDEDKFDAVQRARICRPHVVDFEVPGAISILAIKSLQQVRRVDGLGAEVAGERRLAVFDGGIGLVVEYSSRVILAPKELGEIIHVQAYLSAGLAL